MSQETPPLEIPHVPKPAVAKRRNVATEVDHLAGRVLAAEALIQEIRAQLCVGDGQRPADSGSLVEIVKVFLDRFRGECLANHVIALALLDAEVTGAPQEQSIGKVAKILRNVSEKLPPAGAQTYARRLKWFGTVSAKARRLGKAVRKARAAP